MKSLDKKMTMVKLVAWYFLSGIFTAIVVIIQRSLYAGIILDEIVLSVILWPFFPLAAIGFSPLPGTDWYVATGILVTNCSVIAVMMVRIASKGWDRIL